MSKRQTTWVERHKLCVYACVNVYMCVPIRGRTEVFSTLLG